MDLAACAWMNLQNGFRVPIMAVLCDGQYFYFFKFERQADGRPQIFLGEFPDDSPSLSWALATIVKISCSKLAFSASAFIMCF